MTMLTLHIPLRTPREKGFFNADPNPQSLLGRDAKLIVERSSPYPYLVIDGILARDAERVLDEIQRCLTWAAVRLDQGILTSRGPIQRTTAGIFDGQFPTAYPQGVQAHPMRIDASQRGEESSTRLFAALNEGATKTKLARIGKANPLLIAAELFATADFEVSPNSQFLLLSSVFEVLANPKDRPKTCTNLVDKLLERAKVMEKSATPTMKIALQELRNSAIHLKRESITGAVRKLATKTSKVLGDSDPVVAGKKAALLYGKRSKLVHRGQSVGWGDVVEIRKLVRECIAVEAQCYNAIRERFP
jgi:hypothetical protein